MLGSGCVAACCHLGFVQQAERKEWQFERSDGSSTGAALRESPGGAGDPWGHFKVGDLGLCGMV